VFGIEINVSGPTESKDVPVAVARQAQTYEGTPSNPIRLDEDPKDPVDTQN
jgi:hypothetical protein